MPDIIEQLYAAAELLDDNPMAALFCELAEAMEKQND